MTIRTGEWNNKCDICQSQPLDLDDDGNGSCLNCGSEYVQWEVTKSTKEEESSNFNSHWSALLMISGLGLIIANIYAIYLIWISPDGGLNLEDFRLCTTFYGIIFSLFVLSIIMSFEITQKKTEK